MLVYRATGNDVVSGPHFVPVGYPNVAEGAYTFYVAPIASQLMPPGGASKHLLPVLLCCACCCGCCGCCCCAAVLWLLTTSPSRLLSLSQAQCWG